MSKYMDSDACVFEKSTSDLIDPKSPFTDRAILSVQDTNNGSYNGRIEFDSAVIANSGRFVDYSDALIQIPYIVAVSSSVSATDAFNAFCVALKSGTWHLIDSIKVNLNNKNVVESTTYTNFHVNYKVLSSYSWDKFVKYGDLQLFAPDSPGSYAYDGSASVNGIYYNNNKAFIDEDADKSFAATARLQRKNEGLRKRLEMTANYADTRDGLNWLDASTEYETIGKSFYETSGSGASTIYKFRVLCSIRLADLSDFFQQMPLSRGIKLSMEIRYNAFRGTYTITSASGADPGVITETSYTQLHGTSCPVMLVSGDPGNPLRETVKLNSDPVLTIEGNVRDTTNPSASFTSPISACQLLVPAYTMTPEAEKMYLGLSSKSFSYRDIYSYKFNAGSARFDEIITNSVVNPRRLVLIPYVKGAGLTEPYQNIFDSAPGTPHGIAMTDLQVFVSGRAVFESQRDYDWTSYMYETSKENALCGGQSVLTSGLLSYKDWSLCYRYYVADISRITDLDPSVPKSIRVKGNVVGGNDVDLYAFIEFERGLTLDLFTGAIMGSNN